jgi:hypothetical protein
VCNLYSMTKTQDAMRQLFRFTRDRAGNLPPLPGIFPDNRIADGERALVMARPTGRGSGVSADSRIGRSQ